MKVAEGHNRVMPYLILKGAQAFIDFTENLFGAKVEYKLMREENVIKHAELSIGESRIMFADTTAEFEEQNGMFYIYVEDTDETFRKALELGAEAIMEPFDEEYGARSAGLRDPFGNSWWLATLHE